MTEVKQTESASSALTLEERREKALRTFIERFGPDAGPKKWEVFCKKADLLESESTEAPKKRASSHGGK